MVTFKSKKKQEKTVEEEEAEALKLKRDNSTKKLSKSEKKKIMKSVTKRRSFFSRLTQKKSKEEDIHSIHHKKEGSKKHSLLDSLTPGFQRVAAALHHTKEEKKKRRKNSFYKVSSLTPVRRNSSMGMLDVEDGEGDKERPVIVGRYEQALKANPEDLEALEHLGVFLVGTEDIDKCIEVLTKAIDLGSKSPQVFRAIAGANFEMWKRNQKEEKYLVNAHKYYEQCCRIMAKTAGTFDDAFQADVLYELARVYFYYGSFEGALKMLSNIMMEVPLYKQMNEVMLLNAACLWRLELYEESIKYWEHILENAPKPYAGRHIIFICARMYQKLGKMQDASMAFSEVFQESRKKNYIPFEIKTIRQFVNTPDTWTTVAKLHIERGFWHQAIDLLDVAIDKAIDIDAQFGIEDYDREKLKDLWYDLYTCYDVLEGMSSNDNKELSQQYLAKKLAALDSAHSAQPYDHIIRKLMIEKNVDPAIKEKWTHYFDVEERFALKMQKVFRGNRGRSFARKKRKFETETVIKIQRRFRGMRARRRFLKIWKVLKARYDRQMKKRETSLLKVQATVRMFLDRSHLILKIKSAIIIQAGIRGMFGRMKALRQRAILMKRINERRRIMAIKVQATFRGFRLRLALHRQWAAIDIQAAARGFLTRRRVVLTNIEPQLIPTGRSGFPKGTPGHYRHWMKRLEQSEHLFSDRLEMRMKIGYIQKAHPAISAEAAFCAIAETAGDIDYAIELIGTDPLFADDLYDICQNVDVNQYIRLRPAPVLGPVSEMRTKKNLSRRWMKALQTTATNTAVKVKELERLEDDDYQQFLKNQGKYVEPGNGILPWQQERYSASELGIDDKRSRLYNSSNNNNNSRKSNKTTRSNRNLETQIRAVLTPERTRVFKAGTSQRTSSTRSSLKNGPVPPPRRMFSQVNWTRNHFEETLLDLADELQGEPAHKFHPNRKNDDFLLM